ncbi:MAG: hypothetical protein E6H03_08205 [Bacillati bacterium ANGP1]|uniref:MucB/RseB N-terminal domain-containing protein n=1 Tax=Candidatus Segetimicrobium genomatis TaxID=2569760 RepID=A0A537JAG5_9BACT|nr:MAG: hypothetical protein E6H03_08205 [Terrabacteria group bacterium ANGP1]
MRMCATMLCSPSTGRWPMRRPAHSSPLTFRNSRSGNMPLRIFRQAAVLAVLVLAAGLLGPLLPPGWSASAPPDPALSWLRTGATAPRRVSYAGTKAITLWGGRVEASQVRIYHEAPNATRLEYLAAGAQPRRIVIINGRQAIEYIPAQNRLVARSAPAADEERLTQALLPHIRDNYNVGIDPADQVAGRRALVLDVKSKLPGRPSLRLWVDAEKGLILRFERYGPDGTLQESSAFLKVQFDPVFPPGLFTPPAPPGAHVERQPSTNNMSLAEIAQRVGFSPRCRRICLKAFSRRGLGSCRSTGSPRPSSPTPTASPRWRCSRAADRRAPRRAAGRCASGRSWESSRRSAPARSCTGTSGGSRTPWWENCRGTISSGSPPQSRP